MTQPITLQPGLQNYVPNKSLIPADNCFIGSLKCLHDLDGVKAQQNLINDLQGSCGSSNTYNVLGNDGQNLFHVVETSSCLCRWCCGPSRQLNMDVYLPGQRDPILYFKRPFCNGEGLCGCLEYGCCCANKMMIYNTNGHYLGKVLHRFSLFGEKFQVKNQNEEIVAQINSFCFPCRFSRNIQFQILHGNGIKNLGVIEKKWMGRHPSGISFDHEFFWLSFPSSLNVETKALLIGAAFLMNVVYFEMS